MESGALIKDLHELRVVLFGGLNNVSQMVKEIDKEFDLLVEDLKKANPNSTLKLGNSTPASCYLQLDS